MCSKWFAKRCAKFPCKLTTNTRRNMVKKPTPQKLKKQISFMSYSWKRITKESKFLLQFSGGLDLIILRRSNRITFDCYAKMARIGRKCFIEWGCANSHPANPYRIYKSRHVIGNQTQKLSLNTIICTPDHGSVNTRSQSLIATTILW